LKVEETTSYQEKIDSSNHKKWMDAMRDEVDSMTRKKVWNSLFLHLNLSLLKQVSVQDETLDIWFD